LKSMSFSLPPLPYPKNALEPHMSTETIEFHYGKHHMGYVTKLNEVTKGTPLQNKSLEALITSEKKGKVFNLAAQIWNHTFFWNGLKPNGGGAPQGQLLDLIKRDFGSFETFKKAFTETALNHFGSGWAWLSVRTDGKLVISSKSDAGTPLTDNELPLLTCDVWEHAYYIDYRNNRAAFIEAWWKLVNWDFVASNLARAKL